ncbi:5'-methylthioadenosine/S-adenosylhomocysteine nucleosidase [Aureimonas flava]|uniref:5'-methylthioadenosine/S-adenosylhomocysteine nucleosidase n=1 Tax=Aureimonas flava TaxID=2320271 RepID=A0A3A1WGR3_9HYPH|nr:5'-methylthioadenosine/S-adenosylhomocysteine nucleosidase [Aureimonas flava]RIX97722.1 5'-methylthioadenosine/S-adenosylhomocysteine nucleosidase [Aureimonas flava]
MRFEVPLETVGGRRVLFALAALPEYGPALRARIRPLVTGVGPIEAGVATACALGACAARGQMPDLVVSLGSAGSATLEQGAIYQASHVSWRDMDASPLGFARGVTPFLDLPPEMPLPTPLPGLPTARLSSGADIVSGAAYRAIDADMVDMETFAVLRACQRFGVALIGLRGISDGVSELHRLDDWTALLPLIDGRLADALDRLAETLPGWSPEPPCFSAAPD